MGTIVESEDRPQVDSAWWRFKWPRLVPKKRGKHMQKRALEDIFLYRVEDRLRLVEGENGRFWDRKRLNFRASGSLKERETGEESKGKGKGIPGSQRL